MARILSEKDIDVLKKLAPECEGLICVGSGVPYRSILPPLANHYSKNAEDFRKRLEQASGEDLAYLCELILDGEESLGCVPPDYVAIFLKIAEKILGEKSAAAIKEKYETNHECQV